MDENLPDTPEIDLVPIVAIGASAGGLEPIERYFDNMELNSGCAHIIVQHLSPEFRSLMDQLLARHSDMPIYRIRNGIKLQPNSIYLNLPRSRITIEGNELKFEKIDVDEPYHHPIDQFLKSLAAQRGSEAIAIILSGTGTDGTKGCTAINKAGGTIFVQDPTTTRFDNMPRSVIAKGHQSLVANPDTLAHAVSLKLENKPFDHLQQLKPPMVEDPIDDILSLMKSRFGTDLFQYKQLTIKRRIQRRVVMNRMKSLDELRLKLHSDDEELKNLYADLLIEVTSFFRDPDAFLYIRDYVIPGLIEHAKERGCLRVWIPGCASGEEAYSIGILIKEYLRTSEQALDVKIFATDIHERSMSYAHAGLYEKSLLKSLSPDLILRYFDCTDDHAQVKHDLRKIISFSTHDVTQDPPFSNIDLVCCRNLLIYFIDNAQENVLKMLHFSLRKSGVLFLGPSEHLGTLTNEFEVVNSTWRLFRKRREVNLLPTNSILENDTLISRLNDRTPILPRSHDSAESVEISKQNSTKNAKYTAFDDIISKYAPPGFLITRDGDIEHIFGDAGELLPSQSGSFSRNIIELVRPELKPVVITAINQGRGSNFTQFNRDVTFAQADGALQSYSVSMIRLNLSRQERSMFSILMAMLSFVFTSSNVVLSLQKRIFNR